MDRDLRPDAGPALGLRALDADAYPLGLDLPGLGGLLLAAGRLLGAALGVLRPLALGRRSSP